jgi:hypothetical protein
MGKTRTSEQLWPASRLTSPAFHGIMSVRCLTIRSMARDEYTWFMETTSLMGTSDAQNMVAWITSLLLQRGSSFAENSPIELDQAELADYFASQPGLPQDRELLVGLMEDAVGAHPNLLHRRESAEGVSYWATKRDLMRFQQAPAATGEPPKKVTTPTPRPSRPAEEKPARREKRVAAEEREKKDEEPAVEDEVPVTRQYQLAVLQALTKLGGRGKAAQVISMIPELMDLPPEHQGTYARGPEGKSEEPKYVKFVHSARRFLIKQGEVESPERSIWAITRQGTLRLKDAGLSD